MVWLLLLPFVLNAIVLSFDELYYHRKRGLPKWERVGHPIDVIALLLCWLWMAARPFNDTNLLVYVFLSAFACFLSTKDEWIHAELCEPGEQWIHSMMFILNPVVLFCGGIIWGMNPGPNATNLSNWQEAAQFLEPFILLNVAAYLGVFIFNSVYWFKRGED